MNQLTNLKKDNSPSIKLKMDVFSLIADWYHYGILNLTETGSIKSISQVSKRLDISEKIAEQAVKRLINLGFINIEKGVYCRVPIDLDAGTDIPSEALRKHNRDKMELAIKALDLFSIQERDMSSLTMTFDPKVMHLVKKEIQKFKKKISYLCKSSKPIEVYSLNVQFFPLSNKETIK